MKQRMSRSHKKRRGFKVDSLLERIKARRNEMPKVMQARYMNLTFLGFFDKTLESIGATTSAQVETSIIKVSHKKRKDSSSSTSKVAIGTSEVPINPSEAVPPKQVPTACIPTESFCMNNGGLIKSYILLLRVQYPPTNGAGDCQNQECNVDDEPAVKRRKSTNNNGAVIRALSDETKFFCSELTVYDKHNRCLLTDGDYELGLSEITCPTARGSPRKYCSWESNEDLHDMGDSFDSMFKGPSLKFKLIWSQEAACGLVDRPQPYSENKENMPGNMPPANSARATAGFQIIYQFMYNNNSRQQTEACEDLTCPWCGVNCGVLYALLKHLKLCHSRFTFTYVPIAQGARVDVHINELYDGSYTGSPHDLIARNAFSRNGPTRRTPVTNILVWRPKRAAASLSEFLELDDLEYDGHSRPYITGHNRLYHHTTTCLPVYPKEMEMDSEGENDPEWLQHKTMMMIDEFTDVNEGEKELMKMWNLHVMKHGYVGDCQIGLACGMFLQVKGKELLLKNLYRNFVLHLCSLFDFGLISPVTLYNTVKRLQEMAGETGSGQIRAVLRESRDKQMDNWVRSGVFQQPSSPPAHPHQQAKTTAGVQGRKSAQAVGPHRRKELPLRRKSTSAQPPAGGESTSRKRLSLSLKKDDPQTKPLSS